jgi:hypothetical protein
MHNDTHFAITDVRVRFTQLLDEVESATPAAILERLRKAEAIVAKMREYVAAMPRCDQEGCSALATHGTAEGYGRRCEKHAAKGWHTYPRAKVQSELVAMLEEQDRA